MAVSPDAIAGGAFLAFLPDTPFDPQITGGDLNLFRFNLTGNREELGSLRVFFTSRLVPVDGDFGSFGWRR